MSEERFWRTKTVWIAAAMAALAAGAYFLWPVDHCRSAARDYGIRVPVCPSGDVRQELSLSASELKRGGTGVVRVGASAAYTTSKADEHLTTPIEEFDVSLALLGPGDEERPIEPMEGWERSGDERTANVSLPEVPDGDYELRARVTSEVGESEVELPLAIYAPARIHVLTDRPLYEPGNQVQFRALVVRAGDLSPIDRRPGTWIVRDPGGEVLLEEKAPAGEWGVVGGSFPLSSEARSGDWSVTWRSGEDEAKADFQVEPFTLPRFRVEASADRPFYQGNDRPVLAGRVVYSSGAPVGGADLTIDWRASGEWPPPTAWLEGGLPERAEADEAGRFRIELPRVPADLAEQARLHATLSAVDPAGDRVSQRASLLLSADAIQAQALTELEDGLVQGANNRVYLRVTTADGRPLGGARIRVKRAWSPGDEGIEAGLDGDGVARVQLDPGPPVNVVVPPMPARRPPSSARRDEVELVAARELVEDAEASLDDRLAVEGWLEPLRACSKWVTSGTRSTQVVLRVSRTGAITRSAGEGKPLNACLRSVLGGRRLPAGGERLLRLGFRFPAARLPSLSTRVVDPLGAPDAVERLFEEAALDARDCLPEAFAGEVPGALAWEVSAGERSLALSWVAGQRDGAGGAPPGVVRCLRERAAARRLPEPAEVDRVGLVRYVVGQPASGEDEPPEPQPTILKGYELLISAERDGSPLGETRIVLRPGELPALRVRASPVVAQPGDEVEVELIRGPSFAGELPEKIQIVHLEESREVELDRESRTARFEIPEGESGWFEARARGQRALVYVRPSGELEVSVSPAQERYAPGDTARLEVETALGGEGAQAAVGLFGVDRSLSQLTPLPGPDALAGLRHKVAIDRPAFGVLDAEALALGRIRGAHATEAAVLRVSRVPTPPEVDAVVGGQASDTVDPVAELTEAFYPLLEELHAQTRAWEREAPEGETMTPEKMASLWEQALEAAEARGARVRDAFGRRIRLHQLPDDLLSMTAPGQVVVVGTRLPEDAPSWQAWVKKEKP